MTQPEKQQEEKNKGWSLVDRDMSWLSFNHRVLQEARDDHVPLYDRLKFMGIFSANLDEFFTVRVASLRNIMRLKKKTVKKLKYTPRTLLNKMMETVARQQQELGAIFDLLITELAKHNIILINEKQLKNSHINFVKQYFDEKIKPVLEPIMIHESKEPPFLHNKHLYFAVELKPKEAPSGDPEVLEHAIVEIPTDRLDRFLLLPKLRNKHYVIFLDDVLQYNMHLIFPKHDVLCSYSIKLSRDADLYMDDKLAGDLVKNIKKKP